MRKIEYLVYDLIHKYNIEEFKTQIFNYNEKTLVAEFRKVLLSLYPNIESHLIEFEVLNGFDNPIISYETSDLYLSEFIGDLPENVKLIIIPKFPIGGIFATYKNIKLLIHSNEDVHRNEPHIHIISSDGMATRLNLNTMLFLDEDFLSSKEKKKILNYVKKNKQTLLDYYQLVVEHKEVDKVCIDIIN